MSLIKSLLYVSAALFVFNAPAIAQTQIPFDGHSGIEMIKQGNTYSWVPAQSGPGKGLTFASNAGVSTVEPKLSGDLRLPYANKAVDPKISLKIPVDQKKVAARVAQGLKNAVAAGASTGNGYVAVGALACGLFDCGSALVALADWGIDRLSISPDGSVEIPSHDPSLIVSTGYLWRGPRGGPYIYPSPNAACNSSWPTLTFQPTISGDTASCFSQAAGGVLGTVSRSPSSCPSGHLIDASGACFSPSEAPAIFQPLETYLNSRYIGNGWDSHWAKMTAEIVKNGGNVFTDGTSVDITGPAIIPVSVSEAKTPVNLVPGTTSPAPSGHTGPTESGTQTTTTTTTAKNTYKPAPMSPASSGGPAIGPSMTTAQETKTTTSITNNVTNITNIVNETTTEKDEAPEENATDTPLTGIPELYKQKYPDGLSGVFNDFKSKINTTSFVQLIGALTPNISGAGSCPSWTIDLTWTPGGSMGRHNIGQDFCWIWPILKIIVMVTALFTVRRLIFGG